MATLILRPNAAGDETALSKYPNTGEANWQDVDEVTPDEDATYVYSSGVFDTWYRDLYGLGDTGQTGTINWIKIWARLISSLGGNANAKIVHKSGGTVVESAAFVPTTSWADYSFQYTTKPGGGAWTFGAILNALQAGVSLMVVTVGKEYDFPYCTQVWVEVDYTVGAGRSSGYILG